MPDGVYQLLHCHIEHTYYHEEGISKWNDIICSHIGSQYCQNGYISTIDVQIQCNHNQIPRTFFRELEKKALKFI